MEAGRRLLRCDDGDVVRECRVQRFRGPLERRPALDLGARDLTEGVGPGVRAPGDGEAVPVREHGSQGVADDCLSSIATARQGLA